MFEQAIRDGGVDTSNLTELVRIFRETEPEAYIVKHKKRIEEILRSNAQYLRSDNKKEAINALIKLISDDKKISAFIKE